MNELTLSEQMTLSYILGQVEDGMIKSDVEECNYDSTDDFICRLTDSEYKELQNIRKKLDE